MSTASELQYIPVDYEDTLRVPTWQDRYTIGTYRGPLGAPVRVSGPETPRQMHEETFRRNVATLFTMWADLLRDVGVRAPKPGMGQLRRAVMKAMRRYNVWRIAVLDLPPGGISEGAATQYAQWADRYRALRESVQSQSGLVLQAPEASAALAQLPSMDEIRKAELQAQQKAATQPSLHESLHLGAKILLYGGGGFLLYQLVRNVRR